MLSEQIRYHLSRMLTSIGYDPDRLAPLVGSVTDSLLDSVNESVEAQRKPFEQVLHRCCKKCRLSYIEIGIITKKKYFYCIYSGSVDVQVPKSCPRIGDTGRRKVFESVVEDDDIVEIRNQSTK